MTELGKVRFLRRYPVKSMRGEDLERALVSYSGVAGDRVYAFVDPAKQTNFPWVTAREVPELLLYEPKFREPPGETTAYPERRRFQVDVKTPEGATYDLEDPAFLRSLEARFARPFPLRFSEKGMHDARPVSLFGMSSLQLLSEEAGATLDHRRFRANFYVEWNAAEPLYEERLVGKILQIGKKLRILIDKKDPRCIIINLDPETALADPAVLKTVGKHHQGCIGVYGVTVQEGIAAKDDPVFLI